MKFLRVARIASDPDVLVVNDDYEDGEHMMMPGGALEVFVKDENGKRVTQAIYSPGYWLWARVVFAG